MITKKEKEELEKLQEEVKRLRNDINLLWMRTDRADLLDKKIEEMDPETTDGIALASRILDLERKVTEHHIESMQTHIELMNFRTNVEEVIEKLSGLRFTGTGENADTMSISAIVENMEDFCITISEILRYLDYIKITPVRQRKSISTYQRENTEAP